MPGNLSLTVENLGLIRAFDQIAKAAGVAYEEVVRSETKEILKAAVSNTRAAQVQRIEADVRSREWRAIGAKKYKMSWRHPDRIWRELQEQIKASIKRRKEARGLSKKSWKQLAESLGFRVDVPQYVATATAKSGDHPGDATGVEVKTATEFFIQLTNSRTYDPMIFDAIHRAMSGREKFFKKNLEVGVFQKIGEIASKYPGLSLK